MLTTIGTHMEKRDNLQAVTDDIRIEEINPEDTLNETNNIIFSFIIFNVRFIY